MKNLPLYILIALFVLAVMLYNFPITTLLLIIAALIYVVYSMGDAITKVFRR